MRLALRLWQRASLQSRTMSTQHPRFQFSLRGLLAAPLGMALIAWYYANFRSLSFPFYIMPFAAALLIPWAISKGTGRIRMAMLTGAGIAAAITVVALALYAVSSSHLLVPVQVVLVPGVSLTWLWFVGDTVRSDAELVLYSVPLCVAFNSLMGAMFG